MLKYYVGPLKTDNLAASVFLVRGELREANTKDIKRQLRMAPEHVPIPSQERMCASFFVPYLFSFQKLTEVCHIINDST
jgi:hypothetical protein